MRAVLAAVFTVLVCAGAAAAQTNGDTAGSPIPAGVFLDGGWVPCTHPLATRAGFSCGFYGTLTQDAPVAGHLGFVWHHTGVGWQQRLAANAPITPAPECGGLSLSWIEDFGLRWSDGRRFSPYALTPQERCAFDAYQRTIPPAPVFNMELEVGSYYTDIYHTEAFRVLARITPVDANGTTITQYVIQWSIGPRHPTAAIDLRDPPPLGSLTRVDVPPS
jgi:hypothetical protein